MMIAYELKMSMSEFYATVSQEELGWWHAFFHVKAEREKKDAERARSRSPRRGPNRSQPQASIFED